MAWKYSKQISLGYSAEGARLRKRIYADSKQELKRKERELLMNAEEELQSNIRFGEYAQTWFATYKSNKATRTKEFYQTGLVKLSKLDGMELRNIRRTHLQGILAENWEHPRTCKKLSGIMSQIFRSAVADGLVNRNPAESLDIPKQTRTEKRILTSTEKQAIADADLPVKERLFLDLIRQLGLRPEEARALTRTAINFKERTLTIDKASIFNENKPELKDTKNGKHRVLPLPDGLLESLRSYVKDNKTMLLFGDSAGHLTTKSAYRIFSQRIFNAINKALGGNEKLSLLNGMTFYTLRHTKGTELYYLTQSAQISTKMAAYYMGHSEIVFLSTYSHIDEEKEQIEALRAVTNL